MVVIYYYIIILNHGVESLGTDQFGPEMGS